MSNSNVRARLRAYTAEHLVSLSKIGCQIGLDVKHRYVLSRFARGQDLNADTLTALDKFLTSKGF